MAAIVGIAFIVGLQLLVWSLMWLLWTAVVPALWPTGPEALLDPGYWTFVGFLILLSALRGIIFGVKK